MNTELMKRVKSFAWRLGMATLVFALEFIATNAGLLELPVAVTGVLALLAGEVSKYVNNRMTYGA